MRPEQRDELSRKTELKKQVGQFNRVGQINYNMLWLPELDSSQILSQQRAGDSPGHEWLFGAGWQLSSFLQQLSSGSW